MQNFIIRITQENDTLITDKRIGCFILAESLNSNFSATFTEKAKAAGKLVLTEGVKALDNFRTYRTDGLIVDTSKDAMPQKTLKQIKKQIKNAVIGVICRNRRHEAMLVSECEPDFLIFRFWRDGWEANRELLKWYNELFLIQCAAQVEDDCDFKSLPCDFVILNDVAFSEVSK